jgi:hypothetical protein
LNAHPTALATTHSDQQQARVRSRKIDRREMEAIGRMGAAAGLLHDLVRKRPPESTGGHCSR